MYPILFEYNGFLLPSWHFCFILAVIISFIFFLDLLKRTKFSPIYHAYMLFLIVYISSLIGSRIVSFFTEESGSISNILEIFSLGPMTFYGGVILAIVSGYIYASIKKLPKYLLMDTTAIVVMFGVFLGRIGCFLNGCDYGKIIDIDLLQFTGVNFKTVEGLRYPTQLFESIFCLIVFVVFYIRFIKKYPNIKKAGTCGSILILYGCERFLNECIRDDFRGWIIDGVLSFSQGVSIIIIALGLFLILKKKGLYID